MIKPLIKIPALPATILTLLIFAATLAGCKGHTAASGPPISSTDVKIAELKKSLAEANAKIEELNNKFMLLKEAVDANNDRAEAEREDASAITPPKGLKVVKLSEKDINDGVASKVPGKTASKPAAKKPGSSAEELYNIGQDRFMAGDYTGARKTFKELLDQNPQSSYADNAIYWTAESYYTEQNFKMAYEKFHEVYEVYPLENKAPDAMLKAAYSLKELGEVDKASNTLNELISRYPETPAAEKARKAVIRLTYPK